MKKLEEYMSESNRDLAWAMIELDSLSNTLELTFKEIRNVEGSSKTREESLVKTVDVVSTSIDEILTMEVLPFLRKNLIRENYS